MGADDLAPLFGKVDRPSQEMRYRQGKIVSWNPLTGENVVDVGGTSLTNLPMLNSTEVLLLGPGDVVAVISVGYTMAILGRLTIPGTADAASALGALGVYKSFDSGSGSTTSINSYVDLDGPAKVGPSVDVVIGSSGRAKVTLSAQMQSTPTGNTGAKCAMSFEVTGATSQSAADDRALVAYHQISNASDAIDFHNFILRASYVHFLDDLNPGNHTFTAKYTSGSSATTANFADRLIIVEPL